MMPRHPKEHKTALKSSLESAYVLISPDANINSISLIFFTPMLYHAILFYDMSDNHLPQVGSQTSMVVTSMFIDEYS
ncbi:hypothetical protein BpHYR1_049459 [Brachionus plicatilis]|uniref:Uncharacterized protein n=1 Tax=Brachionus plicatilis TaxID=10195 RepID=A0A3M7R2B8_BRAPC|nr:hypothetical protein BpHYR1_049459 [Brachionus plicatilis]